MAGWQEEQDPKTRAAAERALTEAEEGAASRRLQTQTRFVEGSDVPVITFDTETFGGDGRATQDDFLRAAGNSARIWDLEKAGKIDQETADFLQDEPPQSWMHQDSAVTDPRADKDYAWGRAELQQDHVNSMLKRREELLNDSIFGVLRHHGDALYWNLAHKFFPSFKDYTGEVWDLQDDLREMAISGKTPKELQPVFGRTPSADTLRKAREFLDLSDQYAAEEEEYRAIDKALQWRQETATEEVERLGKDAWLREGGGDPVLGITPKVD
tara:strand:- start:892 stop:1701 length:810 start_codon:yes stop_codon:yes gene_type:complete